MHEEHELPSPSSEDVAFGKKIEFNVQDPAEEPDREPEIMPEIGEGIIKEEEFNSFISGNAFVDKFNGMYESSGGDFLLYVKRGFLVRTEGEAEDNLKVLKHLAGNGILHPATKFGAYKTHKQYQIFLLTPKLERWTAKGEEKEGRDKVLQNIGESNDYEGLLSKGSHVLEWFRRIDPKFNPNKEVDKNSLVHLLNPHKASDSKSWGWDEDGKLYPVDPGVVSIVDEGNQQTKRVIGEWIKEKSGK